MQLFIYMPHPLVPFLGSIDSQKLTAKDKQIKRNCQEFSSGFAKSSINYFHAEEFCNTFGTSAEPQDQA